MTGQNNKYGYTLKKFSLETCQLVIHIGFNCRDSLLQYAKDGYFMS